MNDLRTALETLADGTDPGDDAASIAWSRDGWSGAERFGHQCRAYLNFPGHGEDGAALTRATFGPNYLVELKRKYDDENRSRFNQNIEPEV